MGIYTTTTATDVRTATVGMGEMLFAEKPDLLSCVGLGSCIGLVLYDPVRGWAGMAHIMLPSSSSRGSQGKDKPGKFADTAVSALIVGLESKGSLRTFLRAKMAGGARMFAFSPTPSGAIGEQNILATREALRFAGIRLEAEETGGTKGRSVSFSTETLLMEVRCVGQEKRTL
ncbi:MAG: chemotaxis protein CheD [Synergistales bacterium]